MTPVPTWKGDLAPGQARDGAGNLLLGGIDAARLAQTYGTPLVVIDLDVVDAAIAELNRCARDFGDLEVSYAAKAFATTEFVRHLKERDIGIDVCSLGELVTAECAGFPAERLTLHGAGKSDDELRAACDGRVGTIVVDGIEELERLAELARDGCGAAVALRLNVGVEARTHAFVQTGGEDTKFGIHPRDETAAIATLQANPRLRFAGLHAHVGSQIRHQATYVDSARALLDAAQRFAHANLPVTRLVIGGGFAVETQPVERSERLDVTATIGSVRGFVRECARERGLPLPSLGIEPGRAIVALAGTTLYRVLAVKRQSRRTFVVCDGGIAENPRPALYGARHQVLSVCAAANAELHEMTLCGRSCENDELGAVVLPTGIARGDLLAMCATGAYTYSMAGNYNRFPRPAVVGIAKGSYRLLARRENLDDLLRTDLQASAEDESDRRQAAL